MAKVSSKMFAGKAGYHIKTKKGLDLKITGAPEGEIQSSPIISRVALLGDDYPMVKPSFLVNVGDTVKTGQVLFVDRERPEIKFTSPGAGKVIEINRGEKRRFESIVITLSERKTENKVSYDEVVFNKYKSDQIKNLSKDEIIDNLLNSGLWTSIRNRPFGTIADPVENPHSIFISVVDTHPHSPPPDIFIGEHLANFKTGVEIIKKLTNGKTWLVKKSTTDLSLFFSELSGDSSSTEVNGNLVLVDIEGPHPSGNVGTHIHFLDPVGPGKNVWYINYQDVIAVGYLFITGNIFTERLISVAGPGCLHPALMKTRLGASVDELVTGRKKEGEIRQISGSLLAGNTAEGVKAYLGRYHQQISLIEEGRRRKFLGWLDIGFTRFSVKNIYAANLFKQAKYKFDTSTNGSPRAMVPIEIYEKVMPLDIQPVFLLRSILSGDIERAEELGVLELEEEDLALCTFVSPGKDDFGYLLRTMLNRIKKGE